MNEPRFSDRLREARELGGCSQRELDRLAGKKGRHGAVIESRGTSAPHPDTVSVYAEVLGVDAAWLMFGTGPRPTEAAVRAAIERARAQRVPTPPEAA